VRALKGKPKELGPETRHVGLIVTSRSSKWPELVVDEYHYFDKTNECLRAEELDRVFGNRLHLVRNYPPCFFAGRVGASQFCLLGLNPGYSKGRSTVERRIYAENAARYGEKGWEETYLTFFEWFQRNNLGSRYYSRFAVLLSGILEEKEIPQDKANRYKLLAENLVNIDLIPYHSKRIKLRYAQNDLHQKRLLKLYLGNLIRLIRLCKPRVLFIDGAPYRSLLKDDLVNESLQFVEGELPIEINDRLRARMGVCLKFTTVWFDKFLTSPKAHPTNDELYIAGKKIGKALKARTQ